MTAVNALPPQLLFATGLTVSRGGRTLFSGLDFRLAAGEALLVRGPNGAGKSSLLLALAGILRLEAGTVTFRGAAPPSPTLPARGRVPAGELGTMVPPTTSPLAGEDGRGGAAVAGEATDNDTPRLHLLAHATGLKPLLTVAENLGFWRTLNGTDGATVPLALETVGLGGLDAISAGHLSAGQGKRLALARLLMSRRPVWLLDEPSAALDADGQTMLGRLLAAHLRDGGGAIIATHDEIAELTGAPSLTLGSA